MTAFLSWLDKFVERNAIIGAMMLASFVGIATMIGMKFTPQEERTSLQLDQSANHPIELAAQLEQLTANNSRLRLENGSLMDANQEADALVSLLLGQMIATQNAERSSDDRVTVLTVCALNGALSLVFGESDCGQELDEVHEVFRVYDVDYSGTGAAMLLKRTDDI